MNKLVPIALLCLVTRVLVAEPRFAEVATLLQKHCVDCHAVQDPEGKLVLESFEALMKGGESGPALVPGKSSDSLLVQMIEGRFEKDGKKRVMPPGKREKLSTQEITIIKAWIDAGAPPPTANEPAALAVTVPNITPKVPPRRAILSIAYQPKAKLLALGRIGEVELHSAEAQSLVRHLPAPSGNVNAVAFSPDGQFLFAAGGAPGIKGEVRQWNVGDGTVVRSFSAHHDSIYALAVSPNGKLLASGSYDQKIIIWNIETGSEVRTLSGHNGCVYSLAFRPDGKILASASGDRTIKLWDVESGARRDTLSQPLKEQYSVAFAPDGKRLAAAGIDNRIRVYEISEEARETTNPLLYSKFAHESAILRLAFSADGKLLASSGEDRLVKIWDAATIEERRVLEAQSDWAPAVDFILESKGLAVGRLDGTVAFHDAKTGSMVEPPRPEVARIEPRGVERGITTTVKITGKNFSGVTEVRFKDDRLKATLSGAPGPTELFVKIVTEATLPRGSYELTVGEAKRESAPARLYIDDIPQIVEAESTTILPRLPVTAWGTHEALGDKDIFEFDAQAGETLVFDSGAKSIGSKADLVLTLTDLSGKVLASNSRFDKTGDPLIAQQFSETGKFRLEVSELVASGSPDHYYRVSIGNFRFVTAGFPPMVQQGQTSEIHLIGFNLPKDGKPLSLHATNSSDHPLMLDPEEYRWRGELKTAVTDKPLVIEWSASDSPASAVRMTTPGVAAGRIEGGDHEDWFRFEAKAGTPWIIETAADRLGSPLDTKIEIRDSEGKPVTRVLLQAVRASAVTFRGIDSTTVDCRVENWEEMDLNQFLYLQGEVVRLFREPQGPDSGFNFYALNGKRRNYFDTTATAHADAEPCYIVEPRPVGSKLVANGLPTFPVYFENDDDAERKLGSDSRVYFTPPADGVYFARVTDTRGLNGDRFLYTLTIREARPDFKVTLDGMNPSVARGSGHRFAVNAERIDGFEGEIKIAITGLPSGLTVSNPITIQEGHTAAFGTLYASPDAPAVENIATAKLVASATVNGMTVTHDVGSLGKITVTDSAPLYVELEPAGKSHEIVIAPGESVPARIKVRRNGHNELVTFQLENLPHGVIVDNIGLNGVLIPKEQDEREIFITAREWVPETERYCYAVSNEAGRQTSRPILIKVRSRGTGRVASK